ncbi:hypothetical protein [Phenylobacterium sp.]|uniref:hypothetical protein n=1 Tax=Phenylobacterium sp. TaxID=1871053 RepID=UPI0035B2A27B
MLSRMIAAAAAALALGSSAQAADAGLLGRLVGQAFVVPDARGEPVVLEVVAPAPDVLEIRIAGQVTDRYSLRPGGVGEHMNPNAPDVVSSAAFGPASWSRSYKGLTVSYALDQEGDLVGRLSGAVEAWQSPSFVYAHSPAHPDLRSRLRAAVERAHEEADRYEGHDHAHGPTAQ